MKKGLRRGRSSESLTEHSPKEESRRRRKSLSLGRDRSLPREKKDLVREPSSTSIGREVRCACQYFQSDKLLPERVSLFGSRPLSRDLDMAQAVGEHVYEPINPPPLSTEYKTERPKEETQEKAVFKGSSIPETEKSITRIPSAHDLPKKEPTPVPESKSSENVAEGASAQEIQDEMENRFLSPASAATTPTPASQSRTDVASSGLDSSGFEDMPVKHKSLVKTRRDQMRAQAQEMQQRLRNHAGRIRDRFSHIQRPNIGRKERSAEEPSGEEKPKFKLPEMHVPKITLPDKSKFKLPEKAKFHLPESAKFHLPDKSKFHLPDRSKFHLPEKGKFHLPERPKLNLAERARQIRLPERGRFHLPDKSKFHLPDKSKFHLPEKAKFHLPDKAKFHLPDKSKFHLPDKSKFHLPERAKFNLPNRPKIEMPKLKLTPRESEASPKTSKSRFDFDLKSYPKLFTKHSKEYTTSSPKQTRGRTPPPRMKGEEVPAQSSEKWMQKLDDDLKYVDDDLESAGARETDSRKSESLFEREGYMEDFEKIPQEIRTISTKSSTSRLSDKDISEYSDDRKKGVLEEINPDEFFLRQKGISQDDIDMGKYLSREIREAFRSPDINALAKMDYMDVDDENVDPTRFQGEPQRPKRTGSIKKKSILKKTSTSDPSLSEDGYKTYPPRRPGRKSRSQSKSLLNEEGAIDHERYEEPDVNLSRYDNVEYDDENLSEYYKSPGPAIEYQHYKVPRSHAPISPSPQVKRKSSAEDEGSHKRLHEMWDEEEVVMPSEPPKPAARRKHKKKTSEMESFGEQEQIPQEIMKVPEEVVPEQQVTESPVPPKMAEPPVPPKPVESPVPPKTMDSPVPPQPIESVPSKIMESPVPPKRTRTRSSGSRSLRSLAFDDDVNRSFHSEPPIERLEELESEIMTEQSQHVETAPLVKSASEFLPSRTHEYEITDLDDAGFGYATIGKPTVSKPERQKKTKPERPPPPRRKKEVSVPIYNTYPRRAPIRPLRNYSTVGPSRPPRGKKISPIEKTLSERQLKTSIDGRQSDFSESLDFIEVGSSKDLQTEKVIEKMKGRPLPPPPRPPRQKSKEPEDEFEATEEEKLSLSILKDEEFPLERTVTAFVHEAPVDRQVVEEICTSTQTDPLPEDFSFGTDEGDMIQEFSHEQLRIQQAFLEEMKREEEEIRQRGKTNEGDMIDAELKAEVIRQIEDIIAEEKRILEERKSSERFRREDSGPDTQKEHKKGKSYLETDADMGYASLERRKDVPKQQAQPIPPQQFPQKLDKLQVQELEVGTLNVHEVQSDQIFVKELQSNRIASQDIDNRGGTMALGNVDLPPSVIDQIVAKIPWDSLRQTQTPQQPPTQEGATTPTLLSPPVRPQRRQRGSHQEDSDEEAPVHHRKSHRRHHRPQYSSEEEDRRSSERAPRRHVARVSESPRNIPELSLQLARACTSASVLAIKNFVQTNAAIAQSLDRELCVQVILCIAIALIAAFFLFGYDAKIVHTHRWDFQFPPQPPDGHI